jgi:hypothetical protein
VIIPPLGVFLQVGFGLHFWLNILLTLLGYIPGLIHAGGFATALDYRGQGLLDDETIEPYGQGVLQVFDSPAVMAWWEREGQFSFSQTFRDLVAERKAA